MIDTGEKPYKCTWPNCTRSFSVQSNLKRHAKVHLENGGQQAIAGGNDHLNIESGSGHVTSGFPGGPQSINMPGTSSSGYSTGFLTPQTAQPLSGNYKHEGYFDLRKVQAGQSASHSPAPRFSKPPAGPIHPTSTEIQGYIASPLNEGNAGPRVPSHLNYSTQDPSNRPYGGSDHR